MKGYKWLKDSLLFFFRKALFVVPPVLAQGPLREEKQSYKNLTLVWRREEKQATVYFVLFCFSLKHIRQRKQCTLLYGRDVQPSTSTCAHGVSIQFITARVSLAQSTFNLLKHRAKTIKTLQLIFMQGLHRVLSASEFNGYPV